jgi:1-acyl-sn-glycerol-3-phosphate acyltransferase
VAINVSLFGVERAAYRTPGRQVKIGNNPCLAVFTPAVTTDPPPPPPARRHRKKDSFRAERPAWPIRLLHLADKLISRVWHHTVVLKRPRLPVAGPAILVCNHTSGLDPLLIQSVLDRVVIWMMAKEYYDIKAMTWVFKAIEAIPVDRFGRDSASVRAALRHLHNGRVLGVFPEGRIENSREMFPFQTGVAAMAIKTGAPVYPAFLDGTQRNKPMLWAFLWPNRATLAFGPTVELDRSSSSRENLEAATRKIQDAVQALAYNPTGRDIRI